MSFQCPNCTCSYVHKHNLTRHLQKCKKTIVIKKKETPRCGPHIEKATNVQINNITNNITNNTNNNINIYFNNDVKYFKELVDIMGRESAIRYLLYTLPSTKNLFDVIAKIFMREGVNCPIKVSENGDFLISRGNGKVDIDPTGALLDLENKDKIKDAVLSAFVDNSQPQADRLKSIRLAQMMDGTDHIRSYTEAETEVLNSTYESILEPRRLYEIMDLVGSVRPRKVDYDYLRRLLSSSVV